MIGVDYRHIVEYMIYVSALSAIPALESTDLDSTRLTISINLREMIA